MPIVVKEKLLWRRAAAMLVASIIPAYWAEPSRARAVPRLSGRNSLIRVLRTGWPTPTAATTNAARQFIR
nr:MULTISPECIES: hypothetical protein [Streptomyces]